MKKTGKILTAVFLTAAAVTAAVIVPRALMYRMADAYIRPMFTEEKTGGYFTEYDITDDGMQKVENAYFSVCIPEDYALYKEQPEESTVLYRRESSASYIVITPTPSEPSVRLEQMDLSAMCDVPLWEKKDIADGYMRLCGETPDTLYKEQKYAALFDAYTFDFWDLERTTAYCKLGAMHSMAGMPAQSLVYEKGEVCGVLYLREVVISSTKEAAYSGWFEFCEADKQDVFYSVEVISADLQELYAVINSISFSDVQAS